MFCIPVRKDTTGAYNTTQPNLTYHVKKLENAGLVQKRRDGKFIYYSLVDTPIMDLIKKAAQ